MDDKCFCHLNGLRVKDAIARKITDNFATPGMFGAVGDGIADDTEAIRQALNSLYPVVIFGKGKYRVTSRINVNSGAVKFIDGNGCTILTGALGSAAAFVFDRAVTIENINFDCENSGLTAAIIVENQTAMKDVARVHNVNVKNLYDTDATTGTALIRIRGFDFDVNECHFSDCKKVINGTITDNGGSLTAISLNAGERAANGNVCNCSFKNMSNIDASGALAYEDVACIYVANYRKLAEGETAPDGATVDADGYYVVDENETFVNIENISGINYGKRLIKTQTNNIHVWNVTAHADSEHDDSLSALGISGHKNATIEGVTVTGMCVLPIVSDVKNTTVINCVVDAIGRTNIPGHGDANAAIRVKDDAVVSNCVIKGADLGIDVMNSRNVTITGCTWEATAPKNAISEKDTAFVYISDKTTADNIKIINNTLSGYNVILAWEGSQRTNIVIENNVFNCKKVLDSLFPRVRLYSVKNLTIKNNTFFDEDTGIAQEGTSACIYIGSCENVIIDGVTAIENNPSAPDAQKFYYNKVLYGTDLSGVVVVKNIRQKGYSYYTQLYRLAEGAEVEIPDPMACIFNDCPSVKTPLIVVNAKHARMATSCPPGTVFFVISEKKLYKIENSAFIEL